MFHVCIKMRRCKRRVCKRKTLFGQPNTCATVVILVVSILNASTDENDDVASARERRAGTWQQIFVRS